MMKTYDTLVIGGGLSGVLIAHKLHASGQKVKLFEATEKLGGRFSRGLLPFLPADTDQQTCIQWLNSLGFQLGFFEQQHRPQIYQDGNFQDLAGFGDTKIVAAEFYMPLLSTSECTVTPTFTQEFHRLLKELPFEFQTLSELTQLSKSVDGVNIATINDEHQFAFKNLVFTAAPQKIMACMPPEMLALKSMARLSKQEYWASINVQYDHESALQTPEGVLFLTSQGQDLDVVAGRVTDQGKKSQWMTLIPMETLEDTEKITQILRAIRRQIKRPYPEALNNSKETLWVTPFSHGGDLPASQIKGIPHIWLAHSSLFQLDPLWGSIKAAMAVANEVLQINDSTQESVVAQPQASC